MPDNLPRPKLREEYAAPSSDVERELIGIWKKVLGVEQIGVNDRFVELGGDSLRATYVLACIEEEMGVSLTVIEFYKAQTVAALAEAMEEKEKSPEKTEGRHLVLLQPLGSKRPLFLPHAVDGDAFSYIHLAKALGTARPVYGFQASYRSSLDEDYRVGSMAKEYIREMTRVQPKGPYNLAGFSLGGVIAYEMARQLKASGKDTAFLGIIDMEAPIPELKDSAISRRKAFLREALFFAEDLMTNSWRRREGRDMKFLLRAKMISHLGLGAAGLIKTPKEATLPTTLFTLPESRQRVWRAILEGISEFRPEPYGGHVTIFRGDSPLFVSSPLPAMGWEKLVAGGLDVVQVPGRVHGSQLKPPHVAILAKKVNERMNAVESSLQG